MNELRKLEKWYFSQCDGDWEHQENIRLSTIDNPGWSMKINLECTKWENLDFPEIEKNYDDDLNWIRCWKSEKEFNIACGPLMLSKGIKIFIDWVKKAR